MQPPPPRQVKNATFTFSKDFVSQTLCLVDEETEQRRALAQSKQEWLTAKGFRYPAAKTRQDLITHPKVRHDACRARHGSGPPVWTIRYAVPIAHTQACQRCFVFFLPPHSGRRMLSSKTLRCAASELI